MIKKMVIKNFQAHENKTLEFSDGINLIVGSGDVGKTSIMRALRWNLFNAISGNKFIRRGAKKASVSVYMDSGRSILRERTKSINRYEMDGEEFKAFGQGPVEEILQAHKIREDISFQNQHDGAFLLSWGTGEVTKFLNGLIDLELMSDTLRELNLQYRRTNQSKEEIEGQLEQAQKHITELAFVPAALSTIEAIQEQTSALKDKRSIINEVIAVVEDYLEAEQKLQKYSWVAKASIELGLIEEANRNAAIERNEISALKGTLALHDKSAKQVVDLQWTQTASQDLNKIIKQEVRLEVDYEVIARLHTTQKTIKKTKKYLKYLSGAASLLQDIVDRRQALELIDTNMLKIVSMLGIIQKREDALTNHKVLYEDLFQYGVEMFGGLCPTCGKEGFDPAKEICA